MRLFSVIGLIFMWSLAFAADPLPGDLKPLPPPPTMEPNVPDDDFEPQVTIVKKDDLVIEEYRVKGKLYKVKVTPKFGKPYYLVDERGDGEFSRQDGPDAANMRPPRWVIFNF